MGVVAPSYSYEQLRGVADEFLGRHHTAGFLPVPIEEIIEADFCLDIVPMPGLKTGFDVDAFLTGDLAEIRVDQTIYNGRPNRYRFSLAHELAHLLIHKDIFAALRFSSIAGWKAALASIPADEYQWIEWQAYALAGLILVPRLPLAELIEEKTTEARRRGIDTKDMDARLRRVIESNIGEQFGVSADVIRRRLEKDKLWP